VQNTLTSSSVYTFSVDFRFSNVAAGDIVFGVGSGTSFTGNSTFTTAHGLFWLQSDNGNFEYRTASAWSNVGGTTTFVDGTNYSLRVIANGSASAVTYGMETLGAGTMDIYLDNILVADGVAVTTNGLAANGFRIYSVTGTGIEIDNIQLWNEAIGVSAVPEPSTYALLGVGLVGLFAWRGRTRRRSGAKAGS
jgi:hypothetical protein